MKKVLILLSALALSLSLANAQTQNQYGSGDGTPTMDGVGPYGMWTYLNDAIADLIAENTQESLAKADELQDALTTVSSIREDLRADRLENPDVSIEEFRATHAAEIESLQGAMTTLRDWFRSTRPDRPDPVMTGAMVQRRERFQANSGNLVQLRQRLREQSQIDPNSEECNTIREQIRQALGERKGLLREKRRGESSQSGDGNGKRGG